MKRQLYIFTLWIATLSVLLSTSMMHHHHEGRVCLVEEICTEDGNVNDEHTEHRENEQEGCMVSQMHHFIINAKVAKSIQKQILDGGILALPLFVGINFFPTFSLLITHWQIEANPLSKGNVPNICRRGPPMFSLS